jgi:hypothetical protein
MTQYIPLPRQAKDITGQRFGRLAALGPVGKDRWGCLLWLCRCDCGNLTTAVTSNLISANTRSCGCLVQEGVYAYSRTHGKTKTPTHYLWTNIKTRCLNPNYKQFNDYGGRGITLCAAWIDDFAAFHDYVSSLPHFGEKGYSLDRIDNDGNYEPGNLRWATQSEQTRNTRRNRLLTIGDKTLTLVEWAEISGLPYHSILSRLNRGWTPHDAVSKPILSSSRRPKKE